MIEIRAFCDLQEQQLIKMCECFVKKRLVQFKNVNPCFQDILCHEKYIKSQFRIKLVNGPRAGLKPNGPIAPNWAPRSILHNLVQVDWEPGPIEIVHIGATHLLRPALAGPVAYVIKGP